MTRLRVAMLGLLVAFSILPVSGALARSDSRILARISLGDPVPGPIFDGIVGFGSVWVSVGNDVIARVDPSTNSVVARINVGSGFRHELAAGEGAVWVTNPDEDSVSRINPATNRVVATIPTAGSFPVGVAVASGSVWVSNHHADASGRGSVARIDPSTNGVIATIPLGANAFAGGPGGMVAASGALWVGVPNMGAIARIDPSTTAVSAIVPVDQACGIPAASAGSVWMPGAGCGAPLLSRVDSTSLDVVRFNAGGIARFAGYGHGSLWVTATSASCPPKCPPTASGLAQVDTRTGEAISRLPLEGSGFVAADETSIWVGVGERGEVLRIRP